MSLAGPKARAPPGGPCPPRAGGASTAPWLIRYGLAERVELRAAGDLTVNRLRGDTLGVHVVQPAEWMDLGLLGSAGGEQKQALVLLSRHRDPYALDANLGYTWAGGRRFRFRSVSAGLSFGPLGAGAELVWADGLEGREHWIPMLYASFNAGKDFIPTLAVQRDTWPGGHAWIVILGATVRLWH